MEIFTGTDDYKYDLNEAQMRKKRSIEILKVHNVPYIQHLPVIKTANNVRVRTAKEIAQRAIACLFALQIPSAHNKTQNASYFQVILTKS